MLEAEAAQRLGPQLQRGLDLLLLGDDLAKEAAEVVALKRSVELRAPLVALMLLIRISNDLRCTRLLGERGYPSQVAALCAGSLEVAHTIGYIGSSEERATQWHEHDDPRMVPWGSVWNVFLGAYESAKSPRAEDMAEESYFYYSELCVLKHSNPIGERRVGVRQSELGMGSGPDDSARGHRAIETCFEIAGIAAAKATTFAAKAFLEGDDSFSRLERGVGRFIKKREEFRRYAEAQGWTQTRQPPEHPLHRLIGRRPTNR